MTLGFGTRDGVERRLERASKCRQSAVGLKLAAEANDGGVGPELDAAVADNGAVGTGP